MDRTRRFLDFTQAILVDPSASLTHEGRKTGLKKKRKRAKSSYLQACAVISLELDKLEGLITVFHQPNNRATEKYAQGNSLFQDTGSEIAQASQRIKLQLDKVQNMVSKLAEIKQKEKMDDASSAFLLDTLTAGTASKQRERHRMIIEQTLKKRLAELSKKFRSRLEKRTKSYSRKQASHQKRFGTTNSSLGFGRKPNGAPTPRFQSSLSASKPQSTPSSMQGIGNGSQAPRGGGIRKRAIGKPSFQRKSKYSFSMLDDDATSQQKEEAADDKYNKHNSSTKSKAQMFDRSYHQTKRAMEAQQVEKMISELSQTFTKMATLVAEQGEVVTRIDDNLDQTSAHIDSGQSELLKYYNTLSSERQLILKLIAVVFAIALLFVFVY